MDIIGFPRKCKMYIKLNGKMGPACAQWATPQTLSINSSSVSLRQPCLSREFESKLMLANERPAIKPLRPINLMTQFWYVKLMLSNNIQYNPFPIWIYIIGKFVQLQFDILQTFEIIYKRLTIFKELLNMVIVLTDRCSWGLSQNIFVTYSLTK